MKSYIFKSGLGHCVLFALSLLVLSACVASEAPINLTVGATLKEPVRSVKVSHFRSANKTRSSSFRVKLVSRIKENGYITVLENGAQSELSGVLTIARVSKNQHRTSYKQKKRLMERNGK